MKNQTAGTKSGESYREGFVSTKVEVDGLFLWTALLSKQGDRYG